MTPKIWLLVFMFQNQPMASGPHELEVCLSMAQLQTMRSGYKAHCYNPTDYKREYPDMTKDYLPMTEVPS